MTIEKIQDLEEDVNTNLNFIDIELDEAHSPSAEDIEGIVGHGMKLAAIIALTGKRMQTPYSC